MLTVFIILIVYFFYVWASKFGLNLPPGSNQMPFLNKEGWMIIVLGIVATIIAIIALFIEIKLASPITFIGWAFYLPVLFNVLIPMFILFFSVIGIFYTPWLALTDLDLPIINVLMNGIIVTNVSSIKIILDYSGYILIGVGLIVYIISLYQLLLHTSKERLLFKRGLYAVVRHPQYLGIMVWTLGFTVLGWRLMNYLVWTILCYSYMLLLENEELDLTKLHGPKYSEYCDKVPSILPYPISLIFKPFGFRTNRRIRILFYTIFFILLFMLVFFISISNVVLLR